MHPAFDALVDYAGLFPPASLTMDEAVVRYAEYLAGPDSAMLGRFVVAATRLQELGESLAGQGLLPGSGAGWSLSVVFGAKHPDELARVADFESAFAARGLTVAAVEARVNSPGEVPVVAERLERGWERYLEVPHQSDYDELMAAIHDAGSGAKIRTGGISPESFPTAEQLTQFLVAVTRYSVPFKATAGLHHPWHGVYPLTYAPDSPQYPMHGFVNLMLATAILRAGGDAALAHAVLEESDPTAFERSVDAITWRGERIALDDLTALRRDGFRGFGSCSFREPVDELAAEATA